ncbi:MAG: hypothetical protein ACYC27_01170 [Armatimonadota bacterium]
MSRTIVPLYIVFILVIICMPVSALPIDAVDVKQRKNLIIDRKSPAVTLRQSIADTTNIKDVICSYDHDNLRIKKTVYIPGIDSFKINDLVYRPDKDKLEIRKLNTEDNSSPSMNDYHKMKLFSIDSTSNIIGNTFMQDVLSSALPANETKGENPNECN